MTDTRTLLTGDATADALIAEAEAALEEWGRSIEQGLALAAEMRDLAAQLEEWSC